MDVIIAKGHEVLWKHYIMMQQKLQHRHIGTGVLLDLSAASWVNTPEAPVQNGSPETKIFPPNFTFICPKTTPQSASCYVCWKVACWLSQSSISLEALGAATGQRAAEAGEPEVNGEMKGDEEDEEEELQLVDSESSDITQRLAGL